MFALKHLLENQSFTRSDQSNTFLLIRYKYGTQFSNLKINVKWSAEIWIKWTFAQHEFMKGLIHQIAYGVYKLSVLFFNTYSCTVALESRSSNDDENVCVCVLALITVRRNEKILVRDDSRLSTFIIN